MNLKHSLFAVALLVIASAPANASGLTCRYGYTHATITEGTAVTVNVSQTKQVGQLCLVMEDDNGSVVFDDCGALIGTVTETDAYGQPTKLSHTAVFELLESFKTVDDQPLYSVPLGDPGSTPCAFSVGEAFTQLKWGTGIFRGGSLNATAEGTVSFCPGANRNTFEISGEACLRLR